MYYIDLLSKMTFKNSHAVTGINVTSYVGKETCKF